MMPRVLVSVVHLSCSLALTLNKWMLVKDWVRDGRIECSSFCGCYVDHLEGLGAEWRD